MTQWLISASRLRYSSFPSSIVVAPIPPQPPQRRNGVTPRTIYIHIYIYLYARIWNYIYVLYIMEGKYRRHWRFYGREHELYIYYIYVYMRHIYPRYIRIAPGAGVKCFPPRWCWRAAPSPQSPWSSERVTLRYIFMWLQWCMCPRTAETTPPCLTPIIPRARFPSKTVGGSGVKI